MLDDAELLVAAAVALADGMLGPDELAVVLHQSVREVRKVIILLARIGLVQELPDGSALIRHALLGDEVRSAVPPEMQRQLHASLAAALEQSGADAAFVLDHIEAASDPLLAVHGIRLCLLLCRECLVIGEKDDAIRFLERADRLIRLVDK